MKGYGQFCPVAKAAEILTERWTLLVLRSCSPAAGGSTICAVVKARKSLLHTYLTEICGWQERFES